MNPSAKQASYEVELKFAVENLDRLRQTLHQLGAVEGPSEVHADTYYRHPCRDFVQTREALRIRRVTVTRTDSSGGQETATESRVTYKAPRLPGAIKARQELEWALNPSDPEGEQLHELLHCLGFQPVATVRKSRCTSVVTREHREVSVTLDEVDHVGSYVEVEILARGQGDVEAARGIVGRLSTELGLADPEPRSYLSLLLGSD